MFRIGFAADRADFESAGDIGDSAGAIDALAIESVGVVFASFLRCRTVDVLVDFFFDPVDPPSRWRWDFSVVFDIDDIIGVLIPDVSRRNPSVESVFIDDEVFVAIVCEFSRCSANFIITFFPAIGARAFVDFLNAFLGCCVVCQEADIGVNGRRASVLFKKDVFAIAFDVLSVAVGICFTSA